MGYLRLMIFLMLLLLVGCKGGGGTEAAAVDAGGEWDVEIVDSAGTSYGTMDFVKTGSSTFEAEWDDAMDEFIAGLTVSGTSFTLEWVSEWTQGESECRATTVITGTITETAMTGSGTTTYEVVSGPDPGFDGDVTQLTFSAER